MFIIKFLIYLAPLFFTYSLFVFFFRHHRRITEKAYKRDDLKTESNKMSVYEKVVFWGAVLGLGTLFYLGFNEMLIFIPESWGSIDEYGEWSSSRHGISILLSLLLTIIVLPREAKEDNDF